MARRGGFNLLVARIGLVGDAYVGDVDAESCGKGDLVVLLLEEELADLLGGGELA